MADAALTIPRISAKEYLERERAAPYKSEFVDGIMYAMAGASRQHDLITGDVFGTLLGKVAAPCQVFTSDVKVRIRAVGNECYYYPDSSVTCSEVDNDAYEISQPTLIIEVLSPSTQDADRGYKFDHYRLIAALKEYVLVHQAKPCVEIYRRRSSWEKEVHELDAEITLESVRVTVPVAAFYRRVRF